MIYDRRIAGFVLALACVAIAAVARAAALPSPTMRQDAQKIVFAGAWQLNHELSTNPREAMGRSGEGREGDGGRGGGMAGAPGGGMGGRRGGGMGGPPGGGMGGPPGEGRGGAGNSQDMQKMRELSQLVLDPPEHLLVTGNTDRITLTYPDGRVLRYAATGKSEKQTIEGVNLETKTTWSDADLVVETTMGGGMKATTTYSLNANTRQLVVTVKIESGRSEQRPLQPARYMYDAENSR